MMREITLKTGPRKTSIDRSKIQFAVEEISSGNDKSVGIIRISSISDVLSELERQQHHQKSLNAKNMHSGRIKNTADKLKLKKTQRKTSK